MATRRKWASASLIEKNGKVIRNSNGAVFLELGGMYIVARVAVDGRDAGIVWAPPFRVEVTGRLNPGRNTLHIEVANLVRSHLSSGDYDRHSDLLGPIRTSSSVVFRREQGVPR